MTQSDIVATLPPEEERYARTVALSPGTGGAVMALIGNLGDPSWRVRKAAVRLLPRFAADPLLIPSLVSGLASDDNAGLRNACAEALVGLGEGAVEVLARAIDTPDPDHRKFLVDVLGAIGTASARRCLIRVLDDADVNVRAAAVEALGRSGGAEAVMPLRERLRVTDDLQLRCAILSALDAMGAQVPYEEIAPHHAEAATARLAFGLLGRCGDARALPLLVDGVVRGTRGARRAALLGLAQWLEETGAMDREPQGALAAPECVEAVLGQLEGEDEAVTRAAIVVLGSLAEPHLVPRMLAACAGRSVMESAVDVALALGDAVVAPILRELEGVDIESRVLFIEVLEMLGATDAVPSLLDVARGGEMRTAEAALRALARVGGREIVAPLMDLIRTGAADLARHGSMALARVALKEPDYVAERIWDTLNAGDVRPEWLAVLGPLQRADDIEIIVACMRHDDPMVRSAALEAAAAHGTDIAPESIVFAVADESPRVRAAAAQALGVYGRDVAEQALLVGAEDRDEWVAAQALLGLGRCAGERGLRALHAAAASHSSLLAIAAIQSLFRLNPTDLEDTLRQASSHADPEVVHEVVSATMRLRPERAAGILMECLRNRHAQVRRAAAQQLGNRRIPADAAILADLIVQETDAGVRELLESIPVVSGASAP